MKTFFERINVWLLILFLIGCGIFVFLLLHVSQGWSEIIELRVKIFAIIFSLFLFVFCWLWLIYQARQEKLKLLKIFSGLVILILLLIIPVKIIEHKEQLKESKENELKLLRLERAFGVEIELPKDIIKVGEITYTEGSVLDKPIYYFSIEVENVSEKYCIKNITADLTVYKDSVAFYKNKAELADSNSSGLRIGLNPKGKTTLKFFIDNVNPRTFPPKPWTFSTNVESVVGRHFLE